MNYQSTGFSATARQVLHAMELLDCKEAMHFLEILKNDLFENLSIAKKPDNSKEILDVFINYKQNNIKELFFSIRRSLKKLSTKKFPEPLTYEQSSASQHAATALYFVTACRAVSTKRYDDLIVFPDKCRYLLNISQPDMGDSISEDELIVHLKLVSAIITAAIFGGHIELLPTDYPDLSVPANVFCVSPPNAGDNMTAAFESALYAEVVGNRHDATSIAADSILPKGLRERLISRLEDIREVQNSCLAVIVRDAYGQSRAYLKIADNHQIPVMFPTIEETANLLEVSAETIIAQFGELWRKLKELPSCKNSETTPSPQGDTAMKQPTGNTYQISNNSAPVNVVTNEHSVARDIHISTNANRYSSTDIEELSALFQKTRNLIEELPNTSDKTKASLTGHLDQMETEVKKKTDADPKQIGQSLGKLKAVVETVESSEKLLGHCATIGEKLTNILGPFMS